MTLLRFTPLALLLSLSVHAVSGPYAIQDVIEALATQSAVPTLPASELEDAEQAAISEIAGLHPTEFNSVTGYLVASYREHPERRGYYSRLIERISISVQPQLRDIGRHPLAIFLDDAWKVWAVVYSIESGRSAWRVSQELRAVDLPRMIKFLELLKEVFIRPVRGAAADVRALRNSPLLRRALIEAGVTSAPAMAHALNAYREHKIDPALALRKMQQEMLDDWANSVVKIRDQVRARASLNRPLRLEERFQFASRLSELESIKVQLEELDAHAPELEHSIRPIQIDILTTQSQISRF